jgi:Ribbon-helix-helix protein, copG family
MRTLIDIEEPDLLLLDHLAAEAKRSRASLIREAVADFLRRKRVAPEDEAFGLWGKGKVDGLAYQLKARSEW